MKPGGALVLALVATLFLGCASTPQGPVSLNTATLGASGARVGIAMSEIPKPDTQLPGASCLLCIAAATVANSSLIDHSRTLPLEDLPRLKEEIAKRISAKGGKPIVIAEPLVVRDLPDASGQGQNKAAKDFSRLRDVQGIDKLIVVQWNVVGMWRTYSAYFPTSDPKATVQGVAFMVDLATNTYEWYQPVMVLKASEGAWDEPPKFPGLTNAYFQALELGKDAVLKPLE